MKVEFSLYIYIYIYGRVAKEKKNGLNARPLKKAAIYDPYNIISNSRASLGPARKQLIATPLSYYVNS